MSGMTTFVVVRHGPFAMTTQADIERAIDDFQGGRMGHL
jgi:redox-sensitive bicupin YhaK (pirin superfamily)